MPFCTAAETGILLKKAQGSFTSRSASRTGMVGDLGKLRFLLGSEMDFHTPFNGRESSRLSQRACLCAFRRRRGILRGKGRVPLAVLLRLRASAVYVTRSPFAFDRGI